MRSNSTVPALSPTGGAFRPNADKCISQGSVCQTPPSDIDHSFVEQLHMQLAFISGSFSGSSSDWSALQKDGYAIVEAVKILFYLVLRTLGFFLYTDHKNLGLKLSSPHGFTNSGQEKWSQKLNDGLCTCQDSVLRPLTFRIKNIAGQTVCPVGARCTTNRKLPCLSEPAFLPFSRPRQPRNWTRSYHGRSRHT